MAMLIFFASFKQKIIQFSYVIFYNQIGIIGRTSYKVERTFGSIRRCFGGAVARCRKRPNLESRAQEPQV